jgi:predicted PurR-regulated permease PerM
MPYDTRKLSLLVGLATLLLVLVLLYWTRVVLIPVALAILLTFLLDPVVSLLQRRGLPRTPAVIVVVVVAFFILGGMGWMVTWQFTTLAHELPQYTENLKHKVAELRGLGRGGVIEKAQQALEEVLSQPPQATLPRPGGPPVTEPEQPVPVVVQAPSVLWQLPSLLEPLASAGLVLVLVIFMLLKQSDLRNRLIRLAGSSQLTTTTKALDEAGERISRYLLMQSIINGSFGVAVGLGLFLIGVPYAMLWGFLAAVLRFVPYVGPAVSAILPSAISLAVFNGWMQPFLVIGLILLLELASNLVMEPWLYGQSAGVSEVALLVAVAFWTWLWGPIGLLLATPLTVCLSVLSKYIPPLDFLNTLMGDEPVLDLPTRYYQRLLARDDDEAAEIVETYGQTHDPEDVYDDIMVPALTAAKRDRALGTMTPEDLQFVLQATRAIIEAVELRQSQAAPTAAGAFAASGEEFLARTAPKMRIIGCPARDEADALALVMFQHVLDPQRCALETASVEMLTAEVVSLVEQQGVELICIAALPPGTTTPTRYLCKRLRTRFPACKILVGRWGWTGESDANRALLLAAGADAVGLSLQESHNQVRQWGLLDSSPPPEQSLTVVAGPPLPDVSPARP